MFSTDSEFEDEVRRIARQIWPSAEFSGAAMLDGRERDGIFETEEFVNLIECTVSRSKDKAFQDYEKLDKLIRKLTPKYPLKYVKGWFITLHEPTADQRAVFHHKKGQVIICSFDQFRSKLVDSRSYLTLRQNYAFGSVRDPETGQSKYELKYVPLELVDQDSILCPLEQIVQDLGEGRHVAITGDYGAGKSSTAREIFFSLAHRFWSDKFARFPLMLNLRDHHGQTEPVEALERHARRIGFSSEASLVRAWRAGYTVLILDGFDEIASAGWAGKTTTLRDLRFRSMELIRTFVRESPAGTGILLSGRAHFFDNSREMQTALGLSEQDKYLKLNEFTPTQVKQFLGASGLKDNIPDWLPTRPLLLAYLASRKLLERAFDVDFSSGPAVGWHELLERISEREAEFEAGIDAGTVRRLIERLATVARSTIEGLGPLTSDTIIQVFHTVCGYSPDDKGAALLQRLPGLGGTQAEDGSRVFIDQDFVEAARSGAVFDFIIDPYNTHIHPETWQSALSPLGREVAAYRCRLSKCPPGKITAAFVAIQGDARLSPLRTDLWLILKQLRESYDGPPIYLHGVFVSELEFDDIQADFHLVEFQDSIIALLDIAYDIDPCALPRFRRCYFARIEGRTSEEDLPKDCFIECTFDEFENTTKNTRGILALSLPLGTKVLLTVLRKLYAQSGSGRRESAFYRGLDARAQQMVPSVLQLLRHEEFIARSKQSDDQVWLPVGSVRRRALAILAAPTTSSDSLLVASRELD
ncbi:MAG: NACHT domain-containing protein [Anaerolineae bacterium]